MFWSSSTTTTVPAAAPLTTDIVHSFCERSVNTVLDRIVAAHRKAATADERPLRDLERAALAAGPVRRFRPALAAPGLSLIAEVKRRSPSKGDLAPDLVPAVLAKAYAAGGADCLSVLTDEEFFGGSAEDLGEARTASGLPVLRKDFTVSQADVYDARAMGADAVLLIVAALDDAELSSFRLLKILLESGMPPEMISVVTGSSSEISAALVTSRPVRPMPRTTAVSVDPVASNSSRMRDKMNTS